MTCDQIQAWLDGEAEAADHEVVSAHLAVCQDCQRACAAARALREGLAGEAWAATAADAADEQIVAVLRREGICRADSALEPQSHKEREEVRLRIGLGRWRPLVFSLPHSLAGFNSLTRPRPALWPAVATMTVSFLLTWGSLRWAETRPPAGSASLPATTAAAPAHPPDPELLEKWLAGPPTLGALVWLQPVPAPEPTRPGPTRRGSLPGVRSRVG